MHTPVVRCNRVVATAAAVSDTNRSIGLVVYLRQLPTAGPRRFARGRNVRMFGRPHRLEPPRFEGLGEFRRRDRIFGKKHQSAEFHFRSLDLAELSSTA